MHDSRDNEDMPTTGWFLNVSNLAYREALGGAESFPRDRQRLRHASTLREGQTPRFL